MKFHDLAVEEVERLTEDSVAVTFEVPRELREEFEFVPGQHLVLEREGMRRTYSICVPAGSGRLRVGIRHLPGGSFSTWAVEELRPGDRIAVTPPAGTFMAVPDETRARRCVAIAAGSGITPILSIVASVLESEPHSEVALLYGNRTSSTAMFLEELLDLKDAYPDRFELIHFLSRERQAVDLFSGRIDADRLRRLFDTILPVEDVDGWFICGPLEMIETTAAVLAECGVPPESIHREIFHVGAAPPPPEGAAGDVEASVTVALGGRETTLSMPPDGSSILDAVLAVRGDAPYACKGGICGTCRARLCEGTVRMDHHYALEDAEIEQGYVLSCQAHPTSDRVMLDFDR